MSSKFRFRTKVPSYRHRKGCTQALVTLTDSVTRKRRDYRLGEHGTPESREAYHRVIASWEANGRRWPEHDSCGDATIPGTGQPISKVVLEYWRWAEGYYRPKHMQALVGALRLLKHYFGRTPAAQFGPNNLRLLRDAMIRGDQNADPPRMPWSRKYINSQMQRIRHVFKWSAARELVPASVHHALCTLEPLRRGRSGARENPRVGPVPQHLIDAVRPNLSGPVRAVVDLQLLTGARPGELLGLRPIDIEMDDKTSVWTYRPEAHKNAFREKDRLIYFGPKAQDVIRPFLSTRATNAFLFSPAEAEADRRAALHASRSTPLSCGNRPGSNRREKPQRKPKDHYTTSAYCRAIRYACERAFPPPKDVAQHDDENILQWKARMKSEGGWEDLMAWRKAHCWHPHQLRHNAATALRREFGLEAAQLALGHASAQITDAVYAERDRSKVIEIMRKIG
ncbi:MAG TPA: site-specific integrase [Phycisphaerae bacterium]|nr:site-specific integrase [Phycisphaerae bacterium]